jgi:5'-nucleotidase
VSRPDQIEQQHMHILVSNDDGYRAPGIQALAEALRAIARVTVVAPERDRSGASNSLTLDDPLRLHEVSDRVYSVDGTPTDCVHLAITGLLTEDPDMVVSGINAGANMGDDVIYSGTVAAATEGRTLGRPAIAVSLASFTPRHFDTAARVAVALVERLTLDPLPADTILNVNVPDVPWEALRGFAATRLGQRHRAEPILRSKDPRGRPIYWIGPPGPEQDAGPGTDFYAIRENRVSITPIQVDLTRYQALDQVAGWIRGLEQ